MFIKMHYLHTHIDFFRDNMGDVSEEHVSSWRCDPTMLGDYVWMLMTDDTEIRGKLQPKFACS